MSRDIPSLTPGGAPAITDAAALAVVGALRDLRVEIERSNERAGEARRESQALRERVIQLTERVACLDEAVGRAADAWWEVAGRFAPEKASEENGA